MAVFIGGPANNIFFGDPFAVPENDLMFGNGGSDGLFGRLGNDTLFGGAGQDRLFGEDGNDILEGGADPDFMDGGNGRDGLSYAQSAGPVSVNLGAGTAAGGDATGDVFANMEDLYGSGFDDQLVGSAGTNLLVGGDGSDKMNGGGGRDTLRGDAGRDFLTGGAGRDVFQYFETSDSGAAFGVDTITDFNQGMDTIDLSAIDAKSATAAEDPFFLVFAAAFSGTAGELRYTIGATTVIEGDVDGDAVADLVIFATGPIAFAVTDFVL